MKIKEEKYFITLRAGFYHSSCGLTAVKVGGSDSMNTSQKVKISEMRGKRKTYAAIAIEIGVSENTVKSFCRRNGIGTAKEKFEVCPECDVSLIHLPHKRQKRFCSDKCRMTWWANHPEALTQRAVYHFVCQFCGSEFSAYGNAHRKYCSRSCAAKARRASNE
jgi:hypothetical protein